MFKDVTTQQFIIGKRDYSILIYFILIKKLIVICRAKLVSFISFLVPITTRQLATASYFCLLLFTRDIQISNLLLQLTPELFCKIPFIYCENIFSTLPRKYVIHVPTKVQIRLPGLLKIITAFSTVFINVKNLVATLKLQKKTG